MTNVALMSVARQLESLFEGGSAAGLSDRQLIERFVAGRDPRAAEAAFAALVARHGPMVLGLCRRLLRDAQDAEDAFQAAFLVLARKAGAIRRRVLLSAWLYGVAWRVAVRLRGRTARRRGREQAAVDLDALAADDPAWSDVSLVVHEEVHRLPDAYRSAVVLCCLEGKSNEEAARLLRRPVGTVKSRLTRARQLLRSRLARRGMAVSVGAVGVAVATAPAPASAALANATVRAAVPFAAGEAAAGGLISTRAVALSRGVLRTMFLKKLSFAAALALAVALFGGVGGLAYRLCAGQPGDDAKAAVKTADKPAPDQPKDDKEALQGVWRVAAVETEGVERDDDVARDVKKQTWTIRGDKLVVHIEAPGPARDAKFTYSLDATQTPKTLDLTTEQAAEGSPLKNLHGVYSVDGDVLKFCYAMTGAEVEWWYQNVGKRREGFKELNIYLPAGPRPKEVATKDGSKTTLLTLKRQPAEKEKPKEDNEAIQGVWQTTSIVVGDKEQDDAQARMEKTQRWAVTADRIVIQTEERIDDDRGPPHIRKAEFAYKLDPTQAPKALDMMPQYDPFKGRVMRCIYSLEGDVLKIAHLPGLDGERPKALASKEGDQTKLITLKRVPPEGGDVRPDETKKPDQDKPKNEQPDPEALQGTWQVVSIEVGGKEATGERADQERKAQWVVQGSRVGIRSKDGDFLAGGEVRPDKDPKEIDINPYPFGLFYESDVDKGIYTLDGDVWKVCLAKWPKDESDPPRPKEMATKAGGKAVLITLRRVTAGEEGTKENKPKTPPDAAAPPAGARGEKEQQLLQDWSDAAKKAFELQWKQYRLGTSTAEALVGSSRRLLKAELERSDKKEDRVAAYEAHLQHITDMMDMMKRFVKQAPVDNADAEYYRIEAEILLEREKAK